MYYYLTKNGIILHDCNLSEDSNGSIYYLTNDELAEMVKEIIENVKQDSAKKQEENEKKVLHGDKVTAMGFTFTVNEVLYQEYWNDDGFDCEFTDNKGNYHHWKQWEDKGNLLRWNGREYQVIR